MGIVTSVVVHLLNSYFKMTPAKLVAFRVFQTLCVLDLEVDRQLTLIIRPECTCAQSFVLIPGVNTVATYHTDEIEIELSNQEETLKQTLDARVEQLSERSD